MDLRVKANRWVREAAGKVSPRVDRVLNGRQRGSHRVWDDADEFLDDLDRMVKGYERRAWLQKNGTWKERWAVTAYESWLSVSRFCYAVTNWPGQQVYNAQIFWQRGRRGWSTYDAGNFSHYLPRITEECVRHLREHGHGYQETVDLPADAPSPDDWDAYLQYEKDHRQERLAAWHAMLEEIVAGMKAYTEWIEGPPVDEPVEKYADWPHDPPEAYYRAMARLIEWLPALWD